MNDQKHRYLEQIEGVLSELGATVSAEEVAEVRHLIDHGEPAEGMRTLAYIIDDRSIPVSESVRAKITELCEGLIENDDMPETFRYHNRR